jgi:protein-L-isoaspartate(D-aspartate) O-methyltransferase
MASPASFQALREEMVRRQIAGRGVHDRYVLDAMRRVPRESFVGEDMREYAYEDSPLPIEAGQTISQPYIVALMIEAAQIRPGDRVLEVGAGSGYAAAVMAAIAEQVYTIERHAQLAELARRRFAGLGYRNIEVRVGDGTRGWPEAGPFDAILAAAGGPEVPDVLRAQLAIGGRLVMPVGEALHHQQLVKVTRTDEFRFEQENLGDVAFVPLIGTYGWTEEGQRPVRPSIPVEQDRDRARETPLPARIAAAVERLPDFEDADFGAMFDRYADARVVLLGEASHGTSEFYRARDRITRRLVEHHGFNIVAAEADWPDASVVDRYARHRDPRPDAEPAFQRFPTWMWRNREFETFVEWLREYNSVRAMPQRAGFHGLDLYSLGGSIRAVIDYLDRVDPEAAVAARERYGCLQPWTGEPAEYGRMSLTAGYALCEREAVQMLLELMDKRLEYLRTDGEDFLDAAQNARLIRNAEVYYRTMYYGAAESWNQRDRHMFQTLQHLLDARGPTSKAVVWAHNSHIGDARHTAMAQRGELNIGQLCREKFGRDCVAIGFGTHSGTVAAASDWDAPMQVMQVRPSMEDSYERLFHEGLREDGARGLLDMRADANPAVSASLRKQRLERFIGVVYRPETERWSHYMEASLPRQYDAWVWFDRTSAVSALPAKVREGVPETYPFGL